MEVVGNGVQPNSVVKMTTRNVLTFSAPDGLGTYDGVIQRPECDHSHSLDGGAPPACASAGPQYGRVRKPGD